MTRIALDSAIERHVIDGFRFPLGVYPVEKLVPRAGYVLEFEPADGGNAYDGIDDAEPAKSANGVPEETAGDGQGAEWEEWPDRFMFDVLVGADRLPALVRLLLAMLPPRVYPILDVLGNDTFREIDPYIAYDLVGIERVLDGIGRYGDWLFEDGLVGFGAMSLDPFLYVFVDEHKAVTVRAGIEQKERIERVLAAFDLDEVPEIRGADAVAHEHRGVLVPASADQATLVAEEIVEQLRDAWLLQLNIDAHANIDDDGNSLGVTCWRCVVRCAEAETGPATYAEVLLRADCLERAESLAIDAVSDAESGGRSWLEVHPVSLVRVTAEAYGRLLERSPEEPRTSGVDAIRWYRGDG